MGSDITERSSGYLQSIGSLLWFTLAGLLEWIIPGSWYAKAVDDDVVLLTGAGSGLGRSIALEYAKLGSSLVLWDINEKGLLETQDLVKLEYGRLPVEEGKAPRLCLTYTVDVSDKQAVYKSAAQVLEDLNNDRAIDEPERYVSVLVNNAGIYHGLMLQELKDEQIERIFKINILAHFWTVRAFLPNMIKHEKGHIVEIASMGGIAGLLKQVDYCATKFATVGFEESLSIELEYMGLADKVHTTAICPFFFASNLFTGLNTRVTPLMSSEYVAKAAVMAMRCNHSRLMLPSTAYFLSILKTFATRKILIQYTKAKRLAEAIREIKGRAAGDVVAC